MIDTTISADPNYIAVRDFIFEEAELLDDRRLKEWLDHYVDEGIRYLVPIRQTRLQEDGDGFVKESPLQDDDFAALRMRVNRLGSKAAWAENPPTRVRHHISNIRLQKASTGAESPERPTLQVKSNVLVFRSRGESAHFDLLSAERHDTLVRSAGRLRLLRREVFLDLTTVGTHNLAFIF